MILIAGIPTEAPVEFAIDAAEANGVAYALFDQREHASCRLELAFDPFSGWRGTLSTPGGGEIALQHLSGIYARLMDAHYLPGVVGADPASPEAAHALELHSQLHDWLDLARVRVANRPRAMLSNMSKTYQAGIIVRCGFAIPETLVTNDPDEALKFVQDCASGGDEVIYKSVSGGRSIVQTFTAADEERLPLIRICPTQFQRKVRGEDVRVHVVGQQTFAARIQSGATDYRYALRQSGKDAEVSATEIPPELASACVELAAALDLPFCGIDLRQTPKGGYVCFEANPSPAYSYYEARTGLPIARALVRWLARYESGFEL